MKKPVYNQTSLFGPVYAYLVVISPPDFIKKELNQIHSFPIQINGWGIFDHGESLTVYLRAAYSASLHNLATTLKKSISMPHISLAKKNFA